MYVAEERLECEASQFRLSTLEVSTAVKEDNSGSPSVRLIARDGSNVKAWKGYVGPAEIGLAIRQLLGPPDYSQMLSDLP